MAEAAAKKSGATREDRPYHLRWDYYYSPFKKRAIYRAGPYSIEKVSESEWLLRSSSIGTEIEAVFPTLQGAQDAAFERDTRDVPPAVYLWREKAGLMTALDGFYEVVYHRSAKTLREVLPAGHTSSKPGWALYAGGSYIGCAFDLRSAQLQVARHAKKNGKA